MDPTSLPLRAGAQHSATLFGAMLDCGPDRWGRLLIERAVRKHVLDRKPYRELDYVLALDDASRIGALRFRADADSPFLALAKVFRPSCNWPRCSMPSIPCMAKPRRPRTSASSSGRVHRSAARGPSPPLS